MKPVIPLAMFWLDLPPFDGHPIALMSEPGDPIDVVSVELIVAAGFA
jgi:hypothetical protein